MNISEMIWDLAGQLQALIRVVAAQQGLHPSQAYILFTVPIEGISMTGLAQRLGLDVSTVSRVIDTMVRDGSVRRDRSTEDRRVSKVVLTDTGRQTYSRLSKSLDREVRLVLDTMSIEDRERLGQRLERLNWLLLRRRL